MDRMGTEGAFGVRARALALEAAGRDVIHLEMGEPDFPTPAPVVEAAVRALRDGETGYAPPGGLPVLREALAAAVTRTRGLAVRPEEVVVCPGAKPVIFFTFLALLERGDPVVLPDPGFPIFGSMARALGAEVSTYHPGGAGRRIDLERLRAVIGPRTRLLVLNSPGNPTGAVLRPEELREIGALCREHDVTVLSDEIYGGLVFEGAHRSIATVDDMARRTVVLDGFSKTYSMTGWRLGWAVAPPPLARALEKLIVNSVSCAVRFVQVAAVAALELDGTEREAMGAAFRERRDAMVPALAALPGVGCEPPEGAFFVFADVRATGWNAGTLARRLLDEQAVATVDGADFGAAGAGHLRLSLTAPAPRIREAVARLRNLLDG